MTFPLSVSALSRAVAALLHFSPAAVPLLVACSRFVSQHVVCARCVIVVTHCPSPTQQTMGIVDKLVYRGMKGMQRRGGAGLGDIKGL